MTNPMKKAFAVAGIAIVAFILGAMSMYLSTKEHRAAWITVVSDGAGFGMTTEALNGDIPWPGTTKPSGRVKFLSRDRGEQLGYILKLPIKPNRQRRVMMALSSDRQPRSYMKDILNSL